MVNRRNLHFSFSFQGVISTTRYHLYTADIFVRSFDPDLCLCDIPVGRWSTAHCEISGWGMQEYNNTASYPDSVRAARIEVTGLCCCHDDDANKNAKKTIRDGVALHYTTLRRQLEQGEHRLLGKLN